MLGIRTLVLNNNYMPISIFPLHTIPAEDAITRVFNGTCHVVFDYNRPIKTQHVSINWPSVVARNGHQKIKEVVRLRRESLFYRDHGICAYCERPLSISGLTVDHVLAQSLGGTTVWNNVVAACSRCNAKKGDSKPIGIWKPKTRVYTPNYFDLVKIRRKFPLVIADSEWMTFLGDWDAPVTVRSPC